MLLGENKIYDDLDAISTGSLALDIALGIGGLPTGRVVEIYGPEGSGKTTVALSAIANCQKAGGMAAFVDAEHALDPIYARKLGVDIDNLLVSQPDTGEQALEITEMLVRSGAVDIIVIDSVAALVPRAEIEGEMGDAHVGLQARLMSQALRKLTGTIAKTNTLVMFTNQIRMKIGVMFGNPETTTRRQRPEVLQLGAPGHPPHRRHHPGRGGDRQPGARQGGQEQGGAAVQEGRVRHPLRRGHQQGRRPDRSGRDRRRHPEVGRLVQLRRGAAGPGARERARLPEGEHRPLRHHQGAGLHSTTASASRPSRRWTRPPTSPPRAKAAEAQAGGRGAAKVADKLADKAADQGGA